MNQELWNQFKEGKFNINCQTEEEAREFLQHCYHQGINHHLHNTSWNCFNENTCYFFRYGNIGFCNETYFINHNEKVIIYQELFTENNSKQEDQQQERTEWEKINDEITGEWIEEPEIKGYDICTNQNNKERFLESICSKKAEGNDMSFYFEGSTFCFKDAIKLYQWLGNNIRFALENEPQPKKMTKEGIEKELGYKIKIVE